MKYIQSFYPYPVTFSSIGKTIAARNAAGEMKNIVEISEKELEKLQNKEPFFRELLNNKKIRILNKVPASYVPAAQQLNAANAEADKYKSENEALRARIAELEAKQGAEADQEATQATEAPADNEVIDFDKADYKDLQKYAKDLGIDPNQKKAKLIEELKKAALETVKNDPDAEVTAEEK